MVVHNPKQTPHGGKKNPATGKAIHTSGKAKEKGVYSDDDDDDAYGASFNSRTSVEEDSDDNGSPTTQHNPPTNRNKTIGGRVTKLRSSPRKTPKLNYKLIDDQFSAEEDPTSEKAMSGIGKKMSSGDSDTVEEVVRVKLE